MKLKEIARIQIGYQFRGRVKSHPKGTHAVIQIKDIDDHGQLDRRGLVRINPSGGVARYLVNRGDLLFLSRGKRNRATIIAEELVNTIATSYFYIVHPDRAIVIPEYLAWYLNQQPAQKYFHGQACGSRVLLISKSVFEDMFVAVPEISTQQAIVALNQLMGEEQRLMAEILEKRQKLVRAVCLNAIKHLHDGR